MELRTGESVINIENIIEIAAMASDEIMKIYSTDIENWNSSFAADESPLSKAQNIATSIIYRELEERYPSIPIISESRIPDFFDRKEYNYYFCVSPLDGYKEFVRRNGQWSVNIGLCHGSFPVLGVVYVPCKSSFSKDSFPRVYYAVEGQGAYVRPLSKESENGEHVQPKILECQEFFESDENLRIVMSSLSPVSPVRASLASSDISPEKFLSRYKNPTIVSTSGSNILHRSDSGFSTSSSQIGNTSSETNPNSVSASKSSLSIPSYALSSQLGSQSIVLNILLLAEGKADIYPRLSMSCEWNTCASHAILNEAGGEIIQLAGGMDNSTHCIPGEQVIYNKPHPIHPFFVAYGKRLIPSHLLSHESGLGIPAGLLPGESTESDSQYYTMLAIHAKQEELRRLLDLQDLEYERTLQDQQNEIIETHTDDDENRMDESLVNLLVSFEFDKEFQHNIQPQL